MTMKRPRVAYDRLAINNYRPNIFAIKLKVNWTIFSIFFTMNERTLCALKLHSTMRRRKTQRNDHYLSCSSAQKSAIKVITTRADGLDRHKIVRILYSLTIYVNDISGVRITIEITTSLLYASDSSAEQVFDITIRYDTVGFTCGSA